MKKHVWQKLPEQSRGMTLATRTNCGYIVFRFAIFQYEDRSLSTPMICRGYVASGTAAEAANTLRDWIVSEDSVFSPVTVRVFGVRGGVTERFCGWESLVMAKMMGKPVIELGDSPQSFSVRTLGYKRPSYVEILL